MRVRVCNVARLTHEIFQILPTHAGAQVFYKQLVVCARRRTEAPGTAVVVRRPAPHAPRQLDRDSLAHEPLTVQVAHGILSVAVVADIHETKAIFEDDVFDAAVASKETLQITLANVVVESAYEHPCRHGFNSATALADTVNTRKNRPSVATSLRCFSARQLHSNAAPRWGLEHGTLIAGFVARLRRDGRARWIQNLT